MLGTHTASASENGRTVTYTKASTKPVSNTATVSFSPKIKAGNTKANGLTEK